MTDATSVDLRLNHMEEFIDDLLNNFEEIHFLKKKLPKNGMHNISSICKICYIRTGVSVTIMHVSEKLLIINQIVYVASVKAV